MKKLITRWGAIPSTLGLIAFVLVAFADKTYKVELPLKKWIQHSNGLAYIVKQLDNSDLPARQVRFMIDSIITPLQLDMMQVNTQLPKDTTGKK